MSDEKNSNKVNIYSFDPSAYFKYLDLSTKHEHSFLNSLIKYIRTEIKYSHVQLTSWTTFFCWISFQL